MLKLPKSQQLDILYNMTDDAVPEVAGELDNCVVKLFMNDIDPDGDTVLGDLTELDTPGYAASDAIAWGAPFINDLGNAEVVGDTKQFTCSGAEAGNIAYGYYVTNAAGTVLKYAERFTNPRPMELANQATLVIPRFTMGPQ